MARVFLSYARIDLRAAGRLCQALRRRTGHEIWFDKDAGDLLPGIAWEPVIRKAIRSSRYFVGLFSKQSVSRRGYRHSELRQALEILDEYPEDQIFLVPARLDECRMPHSRLEALHRVDLFPVWEDGVHAICRSLGRARMRAVTTRRMASKKGPTHEFRVALVDLGLGRRTSLSRLARGLNQRQSFFQFAAAPAPRLPRVVERFDGVPNVFIDRIPDRFYRHPRYLAVDLVALFTRHLLAFTWDDRLDSGYLTGEAGPGGRFRFLSAGSLPEYVETAGRTFEEGLVHMLSGELVDFFTETGYHDATRGCLMDYCERLSDVVRGLKAKRLCGPCRRAIDKTPGLYDAVTALMTWAPSTTR